MKHTHHIWIPFAFCLAVVLAAMGWISLTALRLDDAEAAARQEIEEVRRQAALEENVRLALWRMDSALAPLVAQESARPYFAYTTFLPIDRAYGQMFNDRVGDEMLLPSPLLSDVSPDVLVHFQFEPDGRLTSPRVPDEANTDLAIPDYLAEEDVSQAGRHLAHLTAVVDRDTLLAMLPDSTPKPAPLLVPSESQAPQRQAGQTKLQAALEQRARNYVEFNRRAQAVQQSANVFANVQADNQVVNVPLASTDVTGVLMTPLWVNGNLVLARRISAGGREYVQGCVLDWPRIKTALLGTVRDLLPGAQLEPVLAAPDQEESRLLAAVPVRLIPGRRIAGQPVPGTMPAEANRALSPLRLSLVIAWVCVLLAAFAVAALLLGVVRLSEHRASFVSAVTHELRTPLTTFHMYTEMLAEGMVPEGDQQQDYLGTLRNEAARLSHLVENVLSYARLERGRADGRVENVSLGQLIGPIQARLADRAKQAGMELVVEGEPELSSTVVRANPSAVEQILFNLVDNAGKYAVEGSDKRIHLEFKKADDAVHVRLRDHGPGISRSAARHLFRSFSKSVQEAANSAPGIGLGLALSRRLAHDMGGRLELDRTASSGACFVLTLRVIQ